MRSPWFKPQFRAKRVIKYSMVRLMLANLGGKVRQ